MELCYSASFDTSMLTKTKVYKHLQPHLKKALLHVIGEWANPNLMAVAGIAPGCMLYYEPQCGLKSKIPQAVGSGIDLMNGLCFNNVSHSGSFTCTKELLSPGLTSASLSFYKRADTDLPELVKVTTSRDEFTSIRYTGTTEIGCVPFEDCMKTEPQSELLFTVKTATALLKWLRGNKGVVKITLNSTLLAVVFSINEHSLTITFDEMPSNFSPRTKQFKTDKGYINCDLTVYATVDALIKSINICKIPGVSLPTLVVYTTDCIVIKSTFLKIPLEDADSIKVVILPSKELTFGDRSGKDKEALWGSEDSEDIGCVSSSDHKEANLLPENLTSQSSDVVVKPHKRKHSEDFERARKKSKPAFIPTL